MSVLKNLRALSEIQFYKTAITIRKELTIWLLKDFGTRRNAKSVNQIIKDITPEEQAQRDIAGNPHYLRTAGYCHKRKENTDNKIKKRLYFLKNALSFYNFRARGNYSRKSDYNTRAAQAAQTQSAAR